MGVGPGRGLGETCWLPSFQAVSVAAVNWDLYWDENAALIEVRRSVWGPAPWRDEEAAPLLKSPPLLPSEAATNLGADSTLAA